MKQNSWYDNKTHQWPQIGAIFVASLAAFTSGALFAWTSPAISILLSNSSHIDVITLEEASYFTVIPSISAIVASPILAYLTDLIGRKYMVILLGVPHFLAWILIAFATNVYVFYVSRILGGIGDGIIFNALPTFVAEISEPKVRGSWGNLLIINIYLGQFLINLIGAYCSLKISALIFSCLPIICTLLMVFVPESPYFLLIKGRVKEAEVSLQKLRWQLNVENELISLSKDVQRQTSEAGTIKELFTIAVNRKSLLLSLAIRAAQQLSGYSAFAVYTQYIFNQSGSDVSASTSAIIFSGLLVITNTIFAFFVDKFGRRNLMTFSSFGCACVLAIESVYFYIDKETGIDVSFLNWIPLTGMLTYVVILSSGLGIVPTLLMGELFSASIKSKALCVLQIVFSIYVIVVSKMFQTLTSNFGLYLPFGIFSCCCFIGTVFSYFCVPETKGKTLEEIQLALKTKSVSK